MTEKITVTYRDGTTEVIVGVTAYAHTTDELVITQGEKKVVIQKAVIKKFEVEPENAGDQ